MQTKDHLWKLLLVFDREAFQKSNLWWRSGEPEKKPIAQTSSCSHTNTHTHRNAHKDQSWRHTWRLNGRLSPSPQLQVCALLCFKWNKYFSAEIHWTSSWSLNLVCNTLGVFSERHKMVDMGAENGALPFFSAQRLAFRLKPFFLLFLCSFFNPGRSLIGKWRWGSGCCCCRLWQVRQPPLKFKSCEREETSSWL